MEWLVSLQRNQWSVCSGIRIVLINDTDLGFITNDNPATLYYDNKVSDIAQIFVPLAPKLAVLIAPDLKDPRPDKDYINQFSYDGDRFGKIKREQVKVFNRLVVMSAEKVVLHNSAEKWLEKLVNNYKNWRVESVTDRIKVGGGTLILTQQRPIKIEKKPNNRLELTAALRESVRPRSSA